MPKMSDSELKALLQAERNASLGGTLTSDLSTERAKAMDYYNGDMSNDMPAGDGQSSAVSTDVADVIEGQMPGLMDIFATGEEAVRLEPVGPEDEEAAQQETDYVNHVFMQKNPGFMVLYTFIKDSLLSKNGIVKVYWDKTEREERETYLDQDDGAFTLMSTQPDVEVLAHTEHKDEDTGAVTHDVTLVKRKNYGCAKAVNVPPEEFGISKNARTIKEATYCFHQVRKTQSDLIEQGYDEEQVKTLPSYTAQNKEEELARDTLHEGQSASDTMNKASRLIDTIEHYVWMDYEDDGKPALYRVTTGSAQLVVLKRDGKPDVVPVDVMPFAAMTPFPVPHRFFGNSSADKSMDIQKIKTALIRGLLNNIYLLNNQRYEISESHAHERTFDDLLVNRPGGFVRTKTPGGLTLMANQPIGTSLYPALEYMDATREWRTGVTRQGQGIDANALQNQSATAVNQVFTAAQARLKMIARLFAETGIRDMFALIHACIRKNDKKVNTVRLREKWVTVDPREWKTRDDMTINVGLGTGSRDQEVMHLTNIMNIQKEIISSGMPSMQMLVTPDNVYKTAAKLVERIGLKTPEPYFTDPSAPDPQTGQPKQPPPTPPDPKIMEIQMNAQLAEKADQRKAEIEKVQAQADIATEQTKLQGEMMQNERDHQLKKELALFEAQLEMEKFNREEARKDREHAQNMQMREREHSAAMEQGQFSLVASKEQHAQKMEQAKAKPANGGA